MAKQRTQHCISYFGIFCKAKQYILITVTLEGL
jgi:hypothetical protein